MKQKASTELYTESKNDGLEMHMSKTKAIYNNYAQKEIKIGNKEIEIIEEDIYLRKVTRTEEGVNVELNKSLLSGWNAFRKYTEVLKGNLPLNIKRKEMIG